MSKRSGDPLIKEASKKIKHEETRLSSEEKFIEVTRKGEKIMPTNMKKYAGSIEKSRRKWRTRFSCNIYKESKSHKTLEEAEAYRIKINIRENLIKNMIYKYKDEYYCVLTQRQIMKFSVEDIDIVNNHTWYAGCGNNTYNFYAQTLKKKRIRQYHQFIFPSIGYDKTVDHFNSEDTLDNTRDNLRPASKTTQSINQRIQSNNISGIKGVSYHTDTNSWRARWCSDDDQPLSKSFSIIKYGDTNAKNKAIMYRKNMVESTNKYKIAALPPNKSLL